MIDKNKFIPPNLISEMYKLYSEFSAQEKGMYYLPICHVLAYFKINDLLI